MAGLLPQVAVAQPEKAPPATGAVSDVSKAALTERAAVAKAESTGANVEITSLRSESSETYATSEGRLEVVQHVRPVRARVNGSWKPIDNTLVPAADGMVTPKATAVNLAFSGGGSVPLVSLERAGRKLAYSWPGPLPVPVPVLDGDTATYKNVLPDVDLQLRSDTDGFAELLVVRSAEAAKNPVLAELKLSVDAPGLDLAESADGGLEARDEAVGGVVFTAPKPVMWDSPPSTEQKAGARVAAVAEEMGGDGPGDAANVMPVEVEVNPDGSELKLTPDQGMLRDVDTNFPVFIDPKTYAPKAGEWTMVSKYWASSPQWRFNGDSDAGVGYCGWDYCAPFDVKRLFYQFSTSTLAGTSIVKATFVGHETHSGSCDGRAVELWRTKGFGKTTTWTNSSDDWLQKLDTRDVAHGGGSSCPAGDVEFDATAGVKYSAAHDDATTSFGLRASNEDDKYGWKRFSDDAYLRVTYNRPPAQIPMSSLSMNPGGTCKKPESKAFIRSLPTVWVKNVTDPDKDEVSVQFQAAWDAGDGKGTIAHWTSARMTPKPSPADFATTLPSSIPKDKTVSWYARSVDYYEGKPYSYSPWSNAGAATGCYFVYDSTTPKGPTITSAEYPVSDPGAPDDPSYDGVGRYASFTFDAPDTDVTKYWFGVNEEPSAGNTIVTSGGASRTVKFRPTTSGLNFVTAKAFDQAGRGSEAPAYHFKVKAGQPARAQWKLDDPAGAAQAEASAGERTLDVHGAPTLEAAGAVGSAITFDGTADYLSSDIPTVDTSTGFSVAAWVKLSKMPTGAAVIAAQPGNYGPGFELYYSQSLNRWAFNQYSADTPTATPVRAMQATAGGVAAGVWVHLAGTYSASSDQLALYVNGTLAGTTTYDTPWDARRGLQIGAGSYSGNAGSFFPGTIDDVRIYDKPLVQADVARLSTKQPLSGGRPARAVFPLDETATQNNGTPTSEIHGRADAEPAALKNGAKAGEDGAYAKALSLDGVNDYATTVSPHVNNQSSFSVVAWAKLSAKPTHAGIVATQTGKIKPGFELYYSATYGWSFNQYTADSEAGVPVRAAQGDTTKSPAGVWTQLLGSYDAVTNDIRLYVNGAWVATTQFTAPFYGSEPVQIGAGSYSGAAASFFPGQIDDVQLYDRALSAPEASDLYRARPLVEGRWKLDTAAGTPAITPDDLTTAADRHPLTLGTSAAIDATGSNSYVGTGGLLLGGTANDYAATVASPLHTNTSFTASAWVTSPGRPDRPVTVMSQAGANNSGFTVRYVPDSSAPADAGSWQLSMAGTDTTTAVNTVAEHTNFQNTTNWNNIIVVFDAFADQMRLYVDGRLRSTLCADEDDDGSPDEADCTEKVSWNSDVHAFDATKGLQLGRVKTGTTTWGEYWAGAIDDVWMLQGVATDEQIAQLASGADIATNPGP
ncbi:LamG-like jellyroll fold domain-containing protein [Streptomyces sp. NPDC006638]|uniref:LamG-like jellyroll fold domain-containing protein n=1 Tax=Streptomyces sp. NPDC006638 TaxID=3157183 RepID=UPI0033BACC46